MTKIYTLDRYSSQENSTLGLIMAGEDRREFRCYTLEDEHRDIKVAGKTRIPAGTYRIKKRLNSPKFGYLDKRYDWHNGMLWLQNVPDFSYVYLHPGNRHEDTDGCILVGDGAQSNIAEDGMVTHSRIAYERLYKEISELLDQGVQVWLQIVDHA